MASPSPPLTFEQVVALTARKNFLSNLPSLSDRFQDHESAEIALIRQALESGTARLLEPINEAGHGALVCWDVTLSKGLPADVLALAARIEPALGPNDAAGAPPFMQSLGLLLKKSGAIAPERPLAWIAATASDVLKKMDGPGPAPEGALLEWLSAPAQAKLIRSFEPWHWAWLVELAQDKSLGWLRPLPAMKKGLPPGLLSALVDAGLDLAASLENRPLWEHILQTKRPELVGIVSRAMEGSSKIQEAAAQESYLAGFWPLSLKKLGRRSHGSSQKPPSASSRRQAIIDHLVSRSGWERVCDEQGRSAFFHAALADPGVLRHALDCVSSRSLPAGEREKWEAALCHRDRLGRNVWFYLLPNASSATLTEALLDSLFAVAGSCADSQGRGWAYQLLRDPRQSAAIFRLPGQPEANRLPVLTTGALASCFPLGWETLPAAERLQVARSLLGHPSLTQGVLDAVSSTPELAGIHLWFKVHQDPGVCSSKHHANRWFLAQIEKIESKSMDILFPARPSRVEEKVKALLAHREFTSAPARQVLERLSCAVMEAAMAHALPVAPPPGEKRPSSRM